MGLLNGFVNVCNGFVKGLIKLFVKRVLILCSC